ncbi:MAG TPA: PAS domain S-box protein, partial [Candidatus Omnitrophica bacterium]|nr:PAS domain S-box protein [Candidatus Omnitrophota bacterium]
MAMTKEEYIQQEVLPLTQFLLSLLLFPFGVITILLLSILDYFVTPDNFTKFLIYRIITASLIMGLYFILKLKENKILQSIITILGTLTIATMVEVMIFSFGGHQSSYYAGMIIVFVFVLGFIPLSLRMTALVSSMVYAIYFVPIMLFDHITNLPVFINNNIFLISFIFGGLAWRYYNNQLLMKKLSLEYDLAQDKKQLADYSHQLEDMVEERTKELRKSETMLKSLYENANDGIVITDTEGVIIDVNKRAAELHGFDNAHMKGLNVAILELEKNRAVWDERRKRLLDGEALIFETEHYRKDGSAIAFEVSS